MEPTNTSEIPRAARGQVAIAVPCLNEEANLAVLLPEIQAAIRDQNLPARVFVVDAGSQDGSQATAVRCGAEVMVQRANGYGNAVFTAIQYLPAEYLMTLDADVACPGAVVGALYEARTQADIVIASRYVPGGRAETSWARRLLSRWLNRVLRQRMGLDVLDMTSGYRIHRRAAVMNLPLQSEDHAILPELIGRARANGSSITEIPFTYRPRRNRVSNIRLLRFLGEYLPLLLGWAPR